LRQKLGFPSLASLAGNDNKIMDNKVIVILGPTASGKTKLSVELAAKYDGEIISADSRQVYRGMDIGTGKDIQDYRLQFPISNFQFSKNRNNENIINIPYHLIDIVDPNEEFDVMKWVRLANEAIADILKRGKLPIVVGGTGFYLQALVDGMDFSRFGGDEKLRKELEKLSKEELFEKLLKLKKDFAEKLNQSERGNKRRLARYVEIAMCDPEALSKREVKKKAPYDFVIFGVKVEKDILNEKIEKRMKSWFEGEGLIDEVQRLHDEGMSWQRLESFGLEYKYTAQYLQDIIDYEEMLERTNISIRQFAKRQMTWFRRWEKQGMKIGWVENVSEIDF